jgi:putative lipoic acid-binding regulatory protein
MEPEKITFPCDYPIKVVARASAELRDRLDGIFTQHFGEFETHRVSERASAQANFVSLTYVMVVQHVDQLGAVHADLKQRDDVVMVL